MKKFLFFSFLILTFFMAKSQSLYFSDSTYVDELNIFLQPVYKVHAEVEEEYLKFKENWESGKLNDNKFGIVYVSNSMKERGLRPYPHFYNYIKALDALVEKQDLDYYTEWEVGLVAIVETGKQKPIADYLDFSVALICDSVLLRTNSTTWKVNTSEYSISNDPKTAKLYISFNGDVDLICFNTVGQNKDTIEIKRVSGICYPTERKFVGEHGRITWKQAGLGDSVFAKFDDFTLDMGMTKFEFENVSFTNPKLNLFQIPGKLTAKLNFTNRKDISPIFISDDSYFITDIFPEADISCYIKMQGNKLYGFGKNEDAVLYIKDYGQPVVNIKSQVFNIYGDSLIYSGSSRVTFFINGLDDSLTHQNMQIRYQKGLSKRLFDPNWFTRSNIDFSNGYFLTMKRSGKGLSWSPIKDSYHKLYIFSDVALWQKGDSIIYFITTMGSDDNVAIFQSENYFNQNEYDYFSGKGTDNINYLYYIKKLDDSLSVAGDTVNPESFQNFLKEERNIQMPLADIEKLFQKLSYSDFIIYDRYLKTVKPTEKLSRYISNSVRIRKHDPKYEDFDKLMLISKIGENDVKSANIGVNATLNLINTDLVINNIIDFKLAPTVKIYTDQVTVYQDREMKFGGKVGAGLVQLSGANFTYDYQNNTITPGDSTRMNMWYISDTLPDGRFTYKPVATKMDEISGVLYVNKSNDKSNTLKTTKEYPKIETDKKAKIYYNDFLKKFIEKTGGQEFYFEADNFNFDSLNYLTDSVVKFKGTMYTNLFDPLPVTMTLSETQDSSYLGFKECTETNDTLRNTGLRFKNGVFWGCFELTDAGFFGDGRIEYASSVVFAHSFAFLPDEVKASRVDSFYIDREKTIDIGHNEDIPLVRGEKIDFDWTDKQEFSSEKTGDIIIYPDKLADNPGNLKGKLFYHRDSIFGTGTFVFKEAEIEDTSSLGFSFTNSNFKTQVCDFNLKTGGRTLFTTTNLNGDVDVDKQAGIFFSNDTTSTINFAENHYDCIMDHFLWKIGEGIVNIGGVMEGTDSTEYVTTEEAKKEMMRKNKKNIKLYGTILKNTDDELTFNAKTTTYRIEDKVIVAGDVQKLKIADAMMYPRQDITIFMGGRMDTIKNITLEYPYKVFEDTLKYNYLFTFHHGNVVVKNRFDYVALRPQYTYKYKAQIITFNKITVENAPKIEDALKQDISPYYRSVAYKSTLATDEIELNNDFVYQGQGNIKIYADKEFPEFSGYARFDTTCNYKEVPIFPFEIKEAMINEDTVNFDITEEYPALKGKVNTGLYWVKAKQAHNPKFKIVYPFVGKITPPYDPIFQPTGKIYYNKKTGEYRVGPEEMLYSKELDTIQGNVMMYNKDLCLIQAQGEYNMFMDWRGEKKSKPLNHIHSVMKGFYRNNINSDGKSNQVFEVAWGLNFQTFNRVMYALADSCKSNEANPSIFDDDYIARTRKNYNVFLGKQATDDFFDELMSDPLDYRLADNLKYTIMFSNVKFVYDEDSKTLHSVGPIGISNVGGVKIDRYVKGYIKYRPDQLTRMLIIILEPSPGIIFGFRYQYFIENNHGVMDIYLKTRDEAFNNYIANIKEKDRKFKDYIIQNASEDNFKMSAKEYFK